MPEPKYIERGSLLQKAKSLQGYLFAVPLILDAIEYAPTVDVVEVVRCKDCESFISRNGISWCEEHSDGWGDHTVYVDEEDFCSYGTRKEGAEE